MLIVVKQVLSHDQIVIRAFGECNLGRLVSCSKLTRNSTTMQNKKEIHWLGIVADGSPNYG